jgi:signal transduction histidine kinase
VRLPRHQYLPAALVTVFGPALVTLLALFTDDSVVAALVYVLAIITASLAGGIWFGLAASALSLIPFNYFFAKPENEFGFATGEDVVVAVVFVATALATGAVFDRERRARAALDAAAAGARRLQQSAEALSSAVTPAEVLDAVLTESVAAAEARAGLIAVLTEDGRDLEILAQRGYSEDRLRNWHRFPLEGEYPLSYAVRTGEPVFIDSEAERIRRFPALPPITEQTHALVCLPLVVEGRTIGGLTFSFASDQEFDEERRAMKVALARQAAQALDRARLYEALSTAEQRMSFLAEASDVLSSSLDYEETLRSVPQLAVPRIADWSGVDVLDEDGAIRRVAVAHSDPAKLDWGWEISRRFPPRPEEARGVAKVLRTGEPEFLPEIPEQLFEQARARDPEMAGILEELGMHTLICVPIRARDRVLGALTLVRAESARPFSRSDLDLAMALADRAGAAADNALLYREAEQRGEAARALTYVGDGVFLLDRGGVVRYWNRAASLITGVAEEDALDHLACDAVPGWELIEEHVRPADAGAGELARAAAVPVALGEEERWLSVVAVDFGDGRVYAMRDVTEEHALEQARSDFVATASHELRTPLAAVYGAAKTLRREDVDVNSQVGQTFLDMIESEAERLNGIVGQLLLTGQLESGRLSLAETECDLRELVDNVLATVAVSAPETVSFEVEASNGLGPARCDEDKLRQVLVNLVENAVKYSPNGGTVSVALSSTNGRARIEVRDAGLGIPEADHERVFEKFTRLDPGLTRGVGGTGLGLYIARELVERMGGTIAVVSAPGSGSTFTVDLPVS